MGQADKTMEIRRALDELQRAVDATMTPGDEEAKRERVRGALARVRELVD